MSRPHSQVVAMLIGLAAAAAIIVFIWPALTTAFFHNMALNSVILAVLAIGILFAFWQVLRLNGDIDWIDAYRQNNAASTAPRLLAPLAAMVRDKAGHRLTLNATSLRSLLDGIQSRLDESREISRYLISLLIFLGLLGTFWGLLGTIAGVAEAIRNLNISADADPATLFGSLKESLDGPLSGMGIAFSSSLFGLAGSLILGYLDLQAGQAQSRFFNEVEDWLSGQTRLGGSALAEGDQSVPAYIQALLEQTAESLSELQRIMKRAEENRAQTQGGFQLLADHLIALGDHLREQQGPAQRLAESQGEIRLVLARIAELAAGGHFGLDANARGHLRNIDGHLARLAEEMREGRHQAVADIRSEIKLLARTIAALAGEA